MNDPYNLSRFVTAQADVYDLALSAVRHRSLPPHWAAIVFPPMAILGPAFADEFALGSVDEAEAFLEHPLLGNRYREIVSALAALSDCTAKEVFGESGADTVHSSLTLFALATTEPMMRSMLTIWFDGLRHEQTIAALGDDW